MLSILFSAALLAVPVSPRIASPSLDAEASLLLARSRENLLSGEHAVEVTWIRESFLHGIDSLRGRMDFLDQGAARRLVLRGASTEFEWWGRVSGNEHWLREGSAGRLRRLPAHALRKPVLSGPASIEDLAQFPMDYAESFRSCLRLQETDSTYVMTLLPRRGVASLYASIELTLGKSPLLPRRVVFSGDDGRPSRVMEVSRYHHGIGGYFPAELRFFNEDDLASARMLLRPLRSEPSRDHTRVPSGRFSIRPETYWEPRDGARVMRDE